MIDTLKFMDDLKEIKQMVDDQKPRYTIVDKCNEKIAGYQKEVDEFEKWAETQSEQEPFMVTGYREKTTSELLHEGFIEEQKQREKEEEEDK